MKNIFLLFLFLAFCGLVSNCQAETTNLNYNNSFAKRLNVSPSSSQSVADKANKMYGESGNSGIINDPLMNSALGGYYNMMQGMTGGMYDAREIQRQQTDYVKQQMSAPVNEE